jgi:hypothetical protein
VSYLKYSSAHLREFFPLVTTLFPAQNAAALVSRQSD